MPSSIRQGVFRTAETIIIKIGSNVLARPDQSLDRQRIATLARQIDQILLTGRKVIVVSSGAVAAGLGRLRRDQRPKALPELQATAAIGQAELMSAWSESFLRHNHTVGQILLTASDLQVRRRYLNVRNTIRTLFAMDCIPIVNENDSISVDEIAFSDNDQLAAMLATLVLNPLLIILSSVDGFLRTDESGNLADTIETIEEPNSDLQQFVTTDSSSLGRGGMSAKLKAILNAVDFGENVILANGQTDNILTAIQDGQPVGTLFVGRDDRVPAWKKWIGVAAKTSGVLQLDAGACEAVCENGRSLLAVGIRRVQGTFQPGDTVDMQSEDGQHIGKGLVNYAADEVRRIAGQKTEEIGRLLGHTPFAEVIHRDNMTVIVSRRIHKT